MKEKGRGPIYSLLSKAIGLSPSISQFPQIKNPNLEEKSAAPLPRRSPFAAPVVGSPLSRRQRRQLWTGDEPLPLSSRKDLGKNSASVRRCHPPSAGSPFFLPGSLLYLYHRLHSSGFRAITPAPPHCCAVRQRGEASPL